MVTCPRCHTGNLLDSEFCRKCGAGLPEDARVTARAKRDEVLAEGDRMLAAGDADGALAMATGTLDTDPDNVRAITLAMEALLKRGDKAEALVYADRLVEISPDSELDRLRRNYLRESLERGSGLPDAAQRRYAAVAGISAAVFLAGVGLFLNRLDTRSRATETGSVATVSAPVGGPITPAITEPGAAPAPVDPVESPAPTPRTPAETPTAQNPKPAPGPNDVPPVRDDEPRPATRPTPSVPRPVPGVTTTGALPVADPNAALPPAEEPGVAPVTPPITPPTNSAQNGGGDPVPRPANRPPAVRPPNPGIIEIEVSSRPRPGTGNPGGAATGGVGAGGAAPATPGGAGGARSYYEIGLQRYQTGDLAGAAAAFEQALAAGGDPVSVNQRLAQAYGRLGRKGDAAAAYRRAIGAVDSALASGRGDRTRLERTKQACQSALAALG